MAVLSYESQQPQDSSTQVFLRMLRMLRPHWGTLAIAVVLLLMASPAELFPGLTWMYVTDQLLLQDHAKAASLLGRIFSFNGRITGRIHLLFSAACVMFVV